MRCLITGVDDQGRSCVVEDAEVEFTPVEGISGLATAMLHRTNQSPPPPRPPALGRTVGGRLPPGLVRWMVIEHAPYAAYHAATEVTAMHHSDALDLVYVLQGSADYILDDGAHELRAGDCVVTPGVDHAIQAGSAGCRMLALSIGTPPLGA